MSPSIEVRGLVAGVLRGVDLAAGTGPLVVLGPAGAGKTTLLRVLAGQVLPRAGTASVDGADVGAAPLQARAHVGYVPQEVGLPEDLTLFEYLCELLALDGVARAARGDRARAAAGRVHLRGDLHRRLRRFSRGMRRRALIAQALLRRPRVWLADEPTAGLDPAERLAVLSLLRELAEDACLVVASRLTGDAAALPGRVAVLDGGRVAWAGASAIFAGAGAGHVWEVDAAAAPSGAGWLAQPAGQPGRLRVVGAAGALPAGCVGWAAEPTLDDAYFATLLRLRAGAAAGDGPRGGAAPAVGGGAP